MSEAINVSPESNETDTDATNVQVLTPDLDNLPTVPTKLPDAVLAYGENGGARGRVQIKRAKDWLQTMIENGRTLLSQHHSREAALQTFEDSAEFEADRQTIAEKEAKIAEHENWIAERRAEIEKILAGAVEKITAESSKDIDLEMVNAEYEDARITLVNSVKSYDAAGEAALAAIRTFVKTLPTADNLIEGTKPKAAGKSTMPGANNGGEGWKPRFESMSVMLPGKDTWTEYPGVTSIGQLAKALDGGKSYAQILKTLEREVPSRSLDDDKEYTWQITKQDEDKDGTPVITKFKGVALSLAAKNARDKASATPVSATPPVENDSAEVDSTDVD